MITRLTQLAALSSRVSKSIFLPTSVGSRNKDHLAFLRSIEIAVRANEQADLRSVITFSTGVPSGICTDDATQRRR
jgi:hypothetical protein